MTTARILMIHRYFLPDAPPYATMLDVLARGLADDGHAVEVLSTMPTYNSATRTLRVPRVEVRSGVRIHRIRLFRERKDQPVRRALIALQFLLAVIWHVARKHPDVVTFSTMPPVLLGPAVRLGLTLAGGGRSIYHCQDLHPEIEYLGRPPALHHRAMAWIEGRTRRAVSHIVVLSDEMRATLTSAGVDDARIATINNFSLVELEASNGSSARPNDPARLVFAGNMGRFQALDVLADAIVELRERGSKLHFTFVGTGSRRDQLRDRLPSDDPGIEFLDYVPPDQVATILRRSDLGLVTLMPGMTAVAYPSKTLTYLAAGCGLVVLADPGSALSRLPEQIGVGAAATSATGPGLADAIEQATNDLTGIEHATLSAYRQFFTDAVAVDRWRALVATVLKDA